MEVPVGSARYGALSAVGLGINWADRSSLAVYRGAVFRNAVFGPVGCFSVGIGRLCPSGRQFDQSAPSGKVNATLLLAIYLYKDSLEYRHFQLCPVRVTRISLTAGRTSLTSVVRVGPFINWSDVLILSQDPGLSKELLAVFIFYAGAAGHEC